ncbi:MAG: hypothetical protein K6G88_12100 [Lachnospiraceae bacterium]|nr:hypothetical protein [Lachnospiraceae bacterium]
MRKNINKDFINARNVYRSAVALTMIAALVGTYEFAGNSWIVAGGDAVVANDKNNDGAKEAENSNDANKLEDVVKGSISVDSKVADKEESVYVVTDSEGNPNKIIVSDKINTHGKKGTIKDKSDLKDIENIEGDEKISQNGNEVTIESEGKDVYYQGKSDKELPVKVKVKYFLDGKEMSADEIAGKSGRVTIRYDYENNKKVETMVDGNKEEVYVPFVAATGMILNSKFSNIDAVNAKVMSEGNNTIVVGMALPGLKESLKVSDADFDAGDIPEYCEISADVKDFSTTMSLTVISNDLGIDVGKIDLSGVDEKIDVLTDSTDKLVDGSGKLSDGIDTLYDRFDPFRNGMIDLKSGIRAYTDGAVEVKSGIGKVNKSVPKLAKGVTGLKTGINAIYDNFGEKNNEKSLRGGISSISSGASELNEGTKKVEEGTKTLSNGVTQLDTGAGSLKTGAGTLTKGIGDLKEGLATLDTGANTLKTGLEELSKGTSPLSKGAAAVSEGVEQMVGSINTMGQTMSTKSNAILQKLQALGINSLDEAKVAKTNAETMQTLLVQSIATDDYSALASYGVTDAKSAAEMLVTINGQLNSLTEAVTALDAMSQVSGQLSGKTDDMKQLVDGAKQVADGAKAVDEGTGKLVQGAESLTAGTKSASDGAVQLYNGATTLKNGADELKSGTANLKSGVGTLGTGINSLATGANTLAEGTNTYKNGMETLYNKAVVPVNNGINELDKNVPTLKKGIKQLYKGSKKLVSNNKKLNDGVDELADGTDKIKGGLKELSSGANQLEDGMKEFNEKAIDKLIDSYNGDVKSLVRRINALVDANDEYTIYSDAEEGMTTSVKFIIKTDGVSK